MSVKEFKSGRYIDFKYTKGKIDIFGNTFHSHYELYLFLGGKAELINDHARLALNPCQLVIIEPGRYHQFAVEGDADEYERCVLNVSEELLPPEIIKNALCGKEILTLSTNSRIVGNFLYLKELLIAHADDGDLHHILPAVATDIIFAIKNLEQSATEALGGINALSHSIMAYINAHFAEHITLDSLSEVFHVSVSSLCHIFKKNFGLSIKQYITQKRLNAARLYMERGLGAEEACSACGFFNYSAFFRAYKKQFGISPSQNLR